jgi:hypothetical protein
MMDYGSAFLGLILAGVLLMIAGLGLLMPTATGPGASRVTFAERHLIEPSPQDAEHLSSNKRMLPRSDGRPGPKG